MERHVKNTEIYEESKKLSIVIVLLLLFVVALFGFAP